MKLRIRGNSIRLRLSQREVQLFGENGKVEDSIQFGNRKLSYLLATADIPKLKCDFNGDTIQVWVPTELGNMWVNSQLVGMEHLDAVNEKEQVKILIEKDFKCLHVRINEDEADSFPHPKEKVE